MKNRQFNLITIVLIFILGMAFGASLFSLGSRNRYENALAEQEAKLKAAYGDPFIAERVEEKPDNSNVYEGGSIQFLNNKQEDIQKLALGPNNPNGTNLHDGKLHSDTDYYIQYNFPERLQAEIENGDSNFFAEIKYTFQTENSKYVHVEVKVHNLKSKEIYTCSTNIKAADDLCIKHLISENLSSSPNFERDHLNFNIFTSAHADAGPKTTTESVYAKLTCKFSISGVKNLGESKSPAVPPLN